MTKELLERAKKRVLAHAEFAKEYTTSARMDSLYADHARLAEALAAVPDAEIANEYAFFAQQTLAEVEDERDAALAALERVRAVLKSEQFDVREAAFWADGVIEAAVVQKAIDGPTKAEARQAEIDLHGESEWCVEQNELVCERCRKVLTDDFKCPTALEVERGNSDE